MADAFGPIEAFTVSGPDGEATSRSLKRAGLLLGVSTTTANVLGYGFAIVLSRSLGPDDYGALAALLAAGLIGSIPGIALQLLVARGRSREPEQADAQAASWIRLSLIVGMALMLLTWLLAPLAEAYLALDGITPVLWLGFVIFSSTVTGAFQGRLLGVEEHARLSATYITVAGLRFLSGCLAALLGWSISGALGAAAAAGVLASLVCAALAGVPRGSAVGARYRVMLRDLVTACSSTAAVLVLSNVDLVLARHYLPGSGSGHYAVGSLFTKAAFWGPHFLAVLAYPRLARSKDRRAALRASLALTLCIGVAVVLGAFAAGSFLIEASAGPAYADIASLAPAFAALGTGMALVQLTVYAGLARARRVTEILVWVGIVAEIVLVVSWLNQSPGQIVLACLTVTVAVTVAAVSVELAGRPPAVTLAR
jgi:O-antigen/teichoic acid export membrane protein